MSMTQVDGHDLVDGHETGKRVRRGWMGVARAAEEGPSAPCVDRRGRLPW